MLSDFRRRLTMSKRVLLIFSASAVLALVLSALMVIVVSTMRINLSSGIFAALLTLFALGALAGVAAWILGLMQAARGRQWDWFVEVLALGAFGALIFAIVDWQRE
jgi:hypothetical protein